jgi:hypothetical protein
MYRFTGVAVALLAATVAFGGEPERSGPASPSTFTLGLVQKELRPGLSQAEVIERLGSPNVLTRDAEGREAWVYDRASREWEVSIGSVGLGGLGSGGGGSVAGVLGVSARKRTEKARSSQRTLTVVVRFSAAGVVQSFSWHDSRF